MKILFINVKRPLGPVDKIKKGVVLNNSIFAPLDLAYPAALLRDNGFEVSIIDANTKRLSDEEVLNKTVEFNPKIIVLNTTQMDRWQCAFLTIDSTVLIAEKLKKVVDSKILIIGPHNSVTPEWTLSKSKAFDYAICGEPDFTILEMAKRIKARKDTNTVAGIAYIDKGRVIVTPPRSPVENLDLLPMPAYDLLPMNLYPYALLFSSRGCPFKCVFCLQTMFTPFARVHSIKRVIDEMELLEKKYGFSRCYFQDQEFMIDNKRVYEICAQIKKRKLNIKWACNARFDDVRDENILNEMKSANCELINFGLETASEKVIKAANKNLSLEKVVRVTKMLRKINLNFSTYMIIALPGETKETITESINFLVKHDLGIGGGNLPIPYPGTPLYEQAKKEGLNPTWENIGKLAGKVGTKIISEVGGEENLYRFVWINYFKARYGEYYYFNPSFWAAGVEKVNSKIRLIVRKGNFRKIKKVVKGKF